MLMSPLLGSVFLFASTCSPPKKVSGRPQFRYVLASKATSQANFSEVLLRDNRTGRVLWKHHVFGYQSNQVLWSKNHRALLIDSQGEFLIWRAGKPLLKTPYAGVPHPEGLDLYDYPMGYSWSPDARRVLVSFGMSGMADMNYGRLFCLTFPGNHPKYTVLPVDCYVRDMGWRSNRVAVYYPAVDGSIQKMGKPRLWRVPQ